MWWWWTAPPLGSGVDLATAAGWAPAEAEGLIVVAQAPRLGRWLARHRAAALLALAVVPAAHATTQPLQPIAPSLARTARGPVLAWWGESSTGLAAQVARTDVEGLRQVAALRALGWSEQSIDGGHVRVSVFHGVPGAWPAQLPDSRPPSEGWSSALARVHGQWWRLRLTRAGLAAQSGVPPALPECRDETLIVSSNLLLLARGASLPAVGGVLLVTGDGGWGLRVGGSRASLERVLRAVGGRRDAAGDASVQAWRSPFGPFFISGEPGIAIATRAEVLARLPDLDPASEWGCLKGAQIANALTGATTLLDRLPGMPSGDQMTAAAESLSQVQLCSWRIEPSGGHLDLRW